jgi:hypothetical protein
MTITLKTLPTVTAQEVFDHVTKHLLTQNEKSMIAGVNSVIRKCAYRGVGGTSCAAGCLIGDDEYNIDFEYRSWSVLVGCEEVPPNHEVLIQNLQRIHDNSPTAEWCGRLRQLAAHYNLNFTFCEEGVAW